MRRAFRCGGASIGVVGDPLRIGDLAGDKGFAIGGGRRSGGATGDGARARGRAVAKVGVGAAGGSLLFGSVRRVDRTLGCGGTVGGVGRALGSGRAVGGVGRAFGSGRAVGGVGRAFGCGGAVGVVGRALGRGGAGCRVGRAFGSGGAGCRVGRAPLRSSGTVCSGTVCSRTVCSGIRSAGSIDGRTSQGIARGRGGAGISLACA